MSDGGKIHELKVVIRAKLDGYKKDMEKVKSITKQVRDAVNSETSKINGSMGKVSTEKARKEIEKLTASLEKQKEKIAGQENTITRLKGKYDDLINGVTQDKSVTGLEKSLKSAEKELETARAKLDDLWDHYDVFQEAAKNGGSTEGMKELSEQIDEFMPKYDKLGKKVEYLRSRLEQVRMNPEASTSAQELAARLEDETKKLERMKKEADSTKEKLDDLLHSKSPPTIKTKIEQITTKVKELAKNAKTAAKDTTKGFSEIGSKVDALKKRITALAASALIFNVLRSALRSFQEYLMNCLKVNSEFANSLNIIKTNLQVAFAAIYTAVLPAINALMSALAVLSQMFATLLSTLFGSTYSASLKTAQGLKTATNAMNGYGSASKNAQTFSFDEVHNITKEEDSSGGSSDSLMADTGLGDVTADMENGLMPILDKMLEKAKELADIFSMGFKSGFGDLSLEPLQDSIAGIKESQRDIFTDPEVTAAAGSLVNTAAYVAGEIAGSFASVGLTIGTNIFGGINLYLAQNKDLIKEKLVSIFDVTGELLTIQGEFSQAFANIFSAFGGENGQQFTANIIGLFSDTFLNVTELALKLARDISDALSTPFIENQDGIRGALDGLLGTLADITGTLKDSIDSTFASINDMYDQHIKPLADNIGTGLSNITAEFLTFWNIKVQPMLDEMTTKFDSLMKEHIQPMIDKAIEVIGKLADTVGAIWNSVLVPFMEWAIINIGPAVTEMLTQIWDVVTTVVGGISDLITALLEILGGVLDFITGVFTGDWELAWTGIGEIFQGVLDTISSAVSVVTSTIASVFNTALTLVTSIFKMMFNTIRLVLTNIDTKIKTTMENINLTWTGIWTALKDTTEKIFNSLWDTIKSIINSILSGVESMANGVVKALNTIIDALNTLHIEIPDWVPEFGGKTLGFNIATIATVSLPRLAKGGIVDGATALMAGEAGREAIVPLENNTEWIDSIASRLTDYMDSRLAEGSLQGENGEETDITIPVTLEMDGDVLLTKLIKVRKRRGYQIVVEGD